VTAAVRLGGVPAAGLWNANTLGLVASAIAFGAVFLVRRRRRVPRAVRS